MVETISDLCFQNLADLYALFMPLTLAQTNWLIATLGLRIPDEILQQKATAEEFKTRQEEIATAAAGKPIDWRLRKDFDDLFTRALESGGRTQFEPALKLFEEAEQLLQQPDTLPSPAFESSNNDPKADLSKAESASDAAARSENAPGAELMSGWREAKEAVDSKLSALRQELLEDDDPDFARLADSDLFALGRDENVALMKALSEFRGAEAERSAVVVAAQRYQELVAQSPIVPVLDDNPFGVDVALKRTLGAALSKIIAATR